MIGVLGGGHRSFEVPFRFTFVFSPPRCPAYSTGAGLDARYTECVHDADHDGIGFRVAETEQGDS